LNYVDIALRLVKKHEGLRLKPYRDTVGKLSIGYGRNLDDVGISQASANQMLQEDIEKAETDARVLVRSFPRLSDNRKAVLLDMALNMGRSRLGGFRKMLAAIEAGEFAEAARQMLDSKWAGQVKGRAVTLAQLMRQG
jgi:lysozyme